MSNIKYKSLIYDETAILHLYNDNGWVMYTDNPTTLFKGIKHSLDTFAAYDHDTLVGLIRTVGDKETIIYIQDILVLEDYHHQGIGTRLMKYIIDKYPHVRQICLMTGLEDKQKAFYESLGFVEYKDHKVKGFIYKHNPKKMVEF